MSGIITANEQSYEKIIGTGVVVVDFYADWCGPCKTMAPIFEEASVEYEGKALFVKINTDDNKTLAIANKIMSIPTIFFFKNGELKDRVTGVLNKATLNEKLKSLIDER